MKKIVFIILGVFFLFAPVSAYSLSCEGSNGNPVHVGDTVHCAADQPWYDSSDPTYYTSFSYNTTVLSELSSNKPIGNAQISFSANAVGSMSIIFNALCDYHTVCDPPLYNSGSAYIVIAAPPVAPIANFFAFPTNGKMPLIVNFSDTSSNAPTSWNWSFGDGTYNITKNPTHVYTGIGEYDVSLYVSNSAGSDSEIKYSYINVRGECDSYRYGIPYIIQNKLEIEDGLTGYDLSGLDYSINIRDEGTWHNTSSPYTTYQEIINNPDIGVTDWVVYPNIPRNYLGGFYSCYQHSRYLEILKTGYFPYENVNYGVGRKIVSLIPTALQSNPTNCTKTFSYKDAQGNPISNIRVNISGTSEETIQGNFNGFAYGKNNPFGDYTYVVFDQYNNEIDSGSMSCGGTIESVDRVLANINPTITPEPLPNEDIYIFAKDANSGAYLDNYNVAIKDLSNIWYNFTVNQVLGDYTTHTTLQPNFLLDIYVNKTGYIVSHKTAIVSSTPNHKTYIDIPLVRTNLGGTNFTYWSINTYDSISNYIIPKANITLFKGLQPVLYGQTNNAGTLLINITNNTGEVYDIYAQKAGYQDKQLNSQLPYGDYFTSNIYMQPNTVQPTLTEIPIVTPVITPTSLGPYINRSLCRTNLDMDNETLWSPLLNIEACVGVFNPTVQDYLLCIFTIVISGILISRINKSLEMFIVGAIAGDTLCVLSGMIAWTTWIVVLIPFSAFYLWNEKKKAK